MVMPNTVYFERGEIAAAMDATDSMTSNMAKSKWTVINLEQGEDVSLFAWDIIVHSIQTQ